MNSEKNMEETVYKISDLLLILKNYCYENKKKDRKFYYADELVNSISEEFEKISENF